MKVQFKFASLILLISVLLSACAPAATPVPTAVPTMAPPPTAAPTATVPPTSVPPTATLNAKMIIPFHGKDTVAIIRFQHSLGQRYASRNTTAFHFANGNFFILVVTVCVHFLPRRSVNSIGAVSFKLLRQTLQTWLPSVSRNRTFTPLLFNKSTNCRFAW